MRLACAVLAVLALWALPGCGGDPRQEGHSRQSARGAGEPGEAGAGLTSGYVLFSPLLSGSTFLINRRGEVVHSWKSDYAPGASAVLLENGNLLRPARQNETEAFLGGEGGRIQEIDWDGRLVWEWVADGNRVVPHHDVAPLGNGDVLLIAWEKKTREEAIRAGRDPGRVSAAGLWPDCLLEIRPERPAGGRIVWEWHVWDHLIEDRDPRRGNFGKTTEHPELVDINGSRPETFSDEAVARLKSLGYLVGARRGILPTDFLHTNSIAYDPRLDQIALSVWTFNEIWVLDHGTTTPEAAGHSGGRAGRGGDLLYRWGNPRAYGRGGAGNQRLFGPHDARWIAGRSPGDVRLTVFNNGVGRPGRDFSSVIEIALPLGPGGRYSIAPGRPFGPERPAWEYTAPDRFSFLAEYLSSAQRLSDGDTFLCDGPAGRFFEVTPAGRTVWEFRNPFSGDLANPLGDPARSVFRATFVPSGDRALAGRDLRPLRPQPPRR